MNIQSCHFCKHCLVRCNINFVQDFYLMLYLKSYFRFVKYCKDDDPYVIRLPNLSCTRECADEPEGTLCS